MIALDNGPANGDYARYIRDLLERRAAAPLLPNTGFASTFVDPRSTGAPSSGTYAGPQFPASGRDASTSAAQAAAIASALTMGAGAGVAREGPWLEVVGVLIGIAIVVVGALAPSFNGLFVLAGVGLVYAMLKRIGARAAILQTLPGIDRATVRAVGASRKR